MIISFARTTEALLERRKTVTRRKWKDSTAAKFHEGDLVDAWDHVPRVKGAQKVGVIRLTADPYKERLGDMPEADLEAEGGLWASKKEFIDQFGGDPDLEVWVVRFRLLYSMQALVA